MGTTDTKSAKCCPVTGIMQIVGRKWSLLILRALADSGELRYSALADQLPDINSRILCERLSELETEGLVVRTVTKEKPVTVHYTLTEKGADLRQVFEAFVSWGKKWGESVDAPVGDCPCEEPAGC